MKIVSVGMKRFCNDNDFCLSVHPLLFWQDTPTDNAEIFTSVLDGLGALLQNHPD